MSAKLFVIAALLILITTGGTLLSKLAPLKLPSLPEIKLDFPDNPTPAPASSPIVSPATLPNPSTTPKPSPTLKPKPTVKPVVKQAPTPTKECYKYENKCYLKSDYNKLIDLSYQLSSAQTFYQFFLDGVSRYEEEYKKTGSSIYLDAKASQQSKADNEKTKIDQINSQVYNIKLRGY